MKNIFTKTSTHKGKTVVVFAGIHGNETAGIQALRHVVENITLQNGTVHFILGNPEAIKKDVRYVETNLNRDFIHVVQPQSYEQKRARELMRILDSCDALLDLHAYNEPNGTATPFCICEPHCYELTKNLPISKVISGITAFQAGSTNGYMDSQNKIGVVVELGSIETPDTYVELGIECINSFLGYFDLITHSTSQPIQQEFLTVAGVHRKNVEEFSFPCIRKSFDRIKQDELIATDGPLKILAATKGQILFPQADYPTRVESFWFLSKTKNF